jgi:hypothetical protein
MFHGAASLVEVVPSPASGLEPLAGYCVYGLHMVWVAEFAPKNGR